MKRAIRAFCLSLGALVLLLWSVQAMATDKAVDARQPGQGAASLTEYFAILEDPDQALTLPDVQRPEVASRFETGHPPVEALNYRWTSSAYWLRLTLRNTSGQPVKQMLEIGYPLLSHIELHQPAEHGQYQSVVTGAAEPFFTRPYPNRYFVFPLVLPPHSEQVVYLRIRSTITMQIPARLWEPGDFDAWELDDYVTQAWFFGMLTALIVFNFLVFIALRDDVYLSYVIFAMGMALTVSAGNGWGKEFIWPDTTWWSDIAISVIGAWTQAAWLIFMRRLLGTRALVPRLDRVIQVLIGTHLLLSVGYSVSIHDFTVPGSRVVMATLLLVLFVGIYCAAVKKQRLAAYFVMASSLWIAGTVVVGLRGYGVLPSNAFTMNGWQIGAVSEMLLLAFVLAYRFNMIRRKAADDVQQANAGLEARLQAREAELNRSHKLLREIELRQSLYQERQRLMQDMHDGLGSSLTSVLRMAERGRLDKDKMAFVIRGCIDDLKLAIDSYEAVDADLLLLLATLRFRLEPRLEGTGITMRWEVQAVPPMEWLNPRNALHILRILQEAITNIMRHAEATEIRVATRVQGDRVLVTIADNGKGFQVEQAQNGNGKGLSNQMRRAQAIGAEIAWESSGAGTTLTLSLPIVLQADTAEKEGGAGVTLRPLSPSASRRGWGSD